MDQIDSLPTKSNSLTHFTACHYTKCKCKIFHPKLKNPRLCENCDHTWMFHVLENFKLLLYNLETTSNSELSWACITFKLISFILYGCHLIPISLKLVLDQFIDKHLSKSNFEQLIQFFGWSLNDYKQGYHSSILDIDEWTVCNLEEEQIILKIFKSFTKVNKIAIKLIDLLKYDDDKCNLFECARPKQSNHPSLSNYSNKYFDELNLKLNNPLCASTTNFSFGQFPLLINIREENVMNVNLDDLSNIGDDHLIKTDPLNFKQIKLKNSSSTDNISALKNNTIHKENYMKSSKTRTISNMYHLQNQLPTINWNEHIIKQQNNSRHKTRVQCPSCRKTFCDKGALKIHYSAVHLKEMHKCTVPECSTWFNSRRSRNRHSANQNPRLHMFH